MSCTQSCLPILFTCHLIFPLHCLFAPQHLASLSADPSTVSFNIFPNCLQSSETLLLQAARVHMCSGLSSKGHSKCPEFASITLINSLTNHRISQVNSFIRISEISNEPYVKTKKIYHNITGKIYCQNK